MIWTEIVPFRTFSVRTKVAKPRRCFLFSSQSSSSSCHVTKTSQALFQELSFGSFWVAPAKFCFGHFHLQTHFIFSPSSTWTTFFIFSGRVKEWNQNVFVYYLQWTGAPVAVAQLVESPELRFLKELQRSQCEFNRRLSRGVRGKIRAMPSVWFWGETHVGRYKHFGLGY